MPLTPSKEPSPRSASGAPSRAPFLITPADAVENVAVALRVANQGSAWATVRVLPIDAADGATIDLQFPVGLTMEPVMVRAVYATGTTATNLVIHGY